jgi:hypothetical protein
MRRVEALVLSAVVVVLCVIAFELSQLNTALKPLVRIPTSNSLAGGHPEETREQKIDRAARSRLQMRQDERAIEDRVQELIREAAVTSASQQTTPRSRLPRQ